MTSLTSGWLLLSGFTNFIRKKTNEMYCMINFYLMKRFMFLACAVVLIMFCPSRAFKIAIVFENTAAKTKVILL